MEVIAKLNNLNIAPRKVRLITATIKGQNTKAALNTLQFLPNRSARPIKKLLESAIANATHNFNLSADNLKIGVIKVDGGRVGKKFFPRAQGSATTLLSRTSNITIVLREITPGVKAVAEVADKTKTTKAAGEKKGNDNKSLTKMAAKPIAQNKNFNIAPKKAKVFNRKAI
ncbi:MAG TPA: 50S ribosomal protein L22 [Candidatus Paceibacterota bacterium]|nr:50S ribosomal protein L22 [Candidatus Paceibacterota bacterium]